MITFPANPGFNHDLNQQYTLSIFATDGVTMIGPEDLTIEVIDVNEPPTIMNLPLVPSLHQLDLSEAQHSASNIFRVNYIGYYYA